MLLFLGSLLGFCILDSLITALRYDGVYYAVHALHNTAIVYLTAPDVYHTLTDFQNIGSYGLNYAAMELVFALHIYHCVYYFKKLRFDDWLHHGLMIGIALPIGGLVPAGTLLGYSLFFTTGLPGGIDYTLLFLTRNNYLERDTEKRINVFLNTWIRSPGCMSLATFIIAYLNRIEFSMVVFFSAILTAGLNYWNGQYFMAQILYDAGRRDLYLA